MMTSLTPEQIALIQSTWAIPAKTPIDSGEAILYAYFEKYPKNQDKFNSFKNTPLLSLKVRVSFIHLKQTNEKSSCKIRTEEYEMEKEQIRNPTEPCIPFYRCSTCRFHAHTCAFVCVCVIIKKRCENVVFHFVLQSP